MKIPFTATVVKDQARAIDKPEEIMETLAYLHLVQVYEEPTPTLINPDDNCQIFQCFRLFQELRWKKFSSSIFIQFIGISLELAVLDAAHAELTNAYAYLGSSGAPVSEIQKELQEQGYFEGNITGYYGNKTKNAVIKFQRERGLQADGIVGLATQEALTLAQPSQDTSTSSDVIPSPQQSQLSIPPKLEQQNLELTYNIKTPPSFKSSQRLQTIVNEVVDLVTAQKLPKSSLSITLIDVKTGESAEYQENQLRFPASVIKMFWMVELYAQIERGIWKEDDFRELIDKMINQSDNDAASKVLDAISDTQSGGDLSGKEYRNWLRKRQRVNKFFQAAGYKDINIDQKVFPIDYLNIPEPQGREWQMRGNPHSPIYNRITTAQSARLLYEIFTGQSVSQEASSKMLTWLTIDPATRASLKGNKVSDNFNPVRGFLSQDLPETFSFAGKAGWNSLSRDDVALISSDDGRIMYILAISAADRAYANDWQIFPKISQLVLDRMVAQETN